MLYLFISLSGNNRERRRRRKREGKLKWKVRRPGGEEPGRGLAPPAPHGFLWSRRAGDNHPMSFPFPGARPLPPPRDRPAGLSAAPSAATPPPGPPALPRGGDRASSGGPRGQRLPSPSCSEVGFREPGLGLKLAPPLTRCRPGHRASVYPSVKGGRLPCLLE